MRNIRFGNHSFWAGFVGFLIGILFSFAIWAGNRVLQTQALIQNDSSIYTSPNKLTLSLSTPNDQDISSSGTVTISGSTSSSATVSIFGGATDATTDSDGQFSLKYSLMDGENDLVVAAIDADGHEADTTRTIFYTTEPLP